MTTSLLYVGQSRLKLIPKSHIRRVRLKLKTLGAEQLIETLYGHGYRINPSFIEKDDLKVSGADDQVRVLNEETAQIWQQIKASVFKQVDDLGNVITNLAADSPDAETLQRAQKNAHQIAGTVGTFGYDASSHIARAIESLLAAPAPWKSKASLKQLVAILRTELGHPASL